MKERQARKAFIIIGKLRFFKALLGDVNQELSEVKRKGTKQRSLWTDITKNNS